nr:hypothetical protein Itr_chr11CG18690 [Ipomoea trifida]GLL39924.1 hypothetical protein Itr_chr11CG18700 [Ipomoea trifida]GLL39925.1 hypothetical protein Itr_chr11CG18710 [Ipomoea trifida]GLL39926.1 hypothetical protein Itr_chr11CG18720 [Ipomoea trifida]
MRLAGWGRWLAGPLPLPCDVTTLPWLSRNAAGKVQRCLCCSMLRRVSRRRREAGEETAVEHDPPPPSSRIAVGELTSAPCRRRRRVRC